MKRKGWRLAAGILLCAFLISACGAKEKMETAVGEEDWKETDIEEADMGDAEQQPEVNKEVGQEIAEEEPEPLPDWAVAYRNFLAEKENLAPLLLEPGEGNLAGFIEGFFLYDVNGDDVPELFLHKPWASYYIYTYKDAQMELRNVIYDDSFGEFYFGYDLEDGQVYFFTLDYGTGTDRSTGLSKLELLEEAYSTRETGNIPVDEGLRWLYSAAFGGLENDDGSYTDVDWKDAIPGEGNSITTEEFKEILERFVPFEFQQISEENIETCIDVNYLEAVPPCSLETYKNKRDSRMEEFLNTEISLKVKDGGFMADGRMLTGPDGVRCYFDLESLTCYNEQCFIPDFDTEWKQIYWEWMKDIDRQKDANGMPVIEDSRNFQFWLCRWEGTDVPVLGIESMDIPLRRKCFTILDGKVINFGEAGREAMGYSNIVLIDNTEYYFWYWSAYSMPGPWESCNGVLYKVEDGLSKAVWTVKWENIDSETMEEYQHVPEYDAQNPYWEFQGQILPKEEGIAEVDKLLGSGAAIQLLSLCSEETEALPEPLSFAEFGDYYTWEQVIEGLDTFSWDGK